MNKPLRMNVLCVFVNEEKKLLVFERSDVNNSWQFPQGGIEKNESEEEALFREVKEEIGVEKFDVIKKAKNYVDYFFPENLKPIPQGFLDKYSGQRQRWFLCRLAKTQVIDLEKGDGEFKNYKWVEISWIKDHIVSFKKEAYNQGLNELGLLS